MSLGLRLLGVIGIGCSLGVLAAGCSDDEEPTPTERCNEVARTECHVLFACTTEAERTAKGLPAGLNEAGCILALASATQLACETATAEKICAGTEPYNATKAQACINEANKAACETIKANYPSVTQYAPSCGQCVPKFQ